MKKLTLLIATLMAFGGCSNENEVPQLVERSGLNYEVNSQTPFTGTAMSYHDKGQLKSSGTYKDGKLDGLSESYFENGQLEAVRNYKDGIYDGLNEGYREDGYLFYKKNYKDGKDDGLEEWYNKKGQLILKYNYKDGVKIESNSD